MAREKVVRICLVSLKNLFEYARKEFADDIIGVGLPRLLQTLSQRKFKDDDVTNDITALQDGLSVMIKELSSFDVYLKEVSSGRLSRSPVHSEDFFRENHNKFQQLGYTPVKQLCELLDSKDEVTTEMAAFDLGEFARFHPDGKRIIQKLNAKSRLMLLMSHPNKTIAKQALLAVQKLMVTNWEGLNKAGAAGAKR